MPISMQSLPKEVSHRIAPMWPVDRQVHLVLEGLSGRRPVPEICREAGVPLLRYYQWRERFIQGGQASLACSKLESGALEERVRQLEAENASLRKEMRILQDLCLAE